MVMTGVLAHMGLAGLTGLAGSLFVPQTSTEGFATDEIDDDQAF
jgi:hypothetical protein